MNKKTCIITVLVVILIFLGFACSSRNEPVGAGISGSGDNITYVVKKGEQDISALFNLASDTISVQNYITDFSGANNSGLYFAQYARVAEGGWVAWNSKYFAYTAQDLDEDSAAYLCNKIMVINGTPSSMTLEKAAVLIPCMKTP